MDPRRTSPLVHRETLTASGGTARLSERPFHGLVALRGARRTVAAAARKAMGFALPSKAGKSTRANSKRAIWIGPDEWVLVSEPDGETGLIENLQSALDDKHYQAVDVTDYYTTIEVGGSRARELLAKLITIDLHHRHFLTDDAVATNFAKASGWLVLVESQEDGSDVFQLFVRRSMADYLWCMLAEAGREWGLPQQIPIGKVKLHLPHFENSSAPD